jgi:hypothetical protein
LRGRAGKQKQHEKEYNHFISLFMCKNYQLIASQEWRRLAALSCIMDDLKRINYSCEA